MNLIEINSDEAAKLNALDLLPFFTSNADFAKIPKHDSEISRAYDRELKAKLSPKGPDRWPMGRSQITDDNHYLFRQSCFGHLNLDVTCVFDLVANRMVGHYFI